MRQEATKEANKKTDGEETNTVVPDEKKNDKAEKKSDSMEVDGDAAEPDEGSKKKKKKGAKEEGTKEKGNYFALNDVLI